MLAVEQELIRAFHTHPPLGGVPVSAAIQDGRRVKRRRRITKGVGFASLAIACGTLTMVNVLGTQDSNLRLVGAGLTVHEEPGVSQIADDRVGLGDGVEAWRSGDSLAVGYPQGTFIFLSADDAAVNWDQIGKFPALITGPEVGHGMTLVLGTVRGDPTSVTVQAAGSQVEASVACFSQSPGWCLYKAILPNSQPSQADVTVQIN